ncbi:MAG TPA: hypothetical protein VG942_01000 [Hyphomonadaceae bacterium]|nr:hypothetical protein [Hyphomonadaceae bacterium]
MKGRILAVQFAVASAISAAAASCATAPQPPPEQIADACLLLKDNRNWYNALRDTAHQWGAPMGYQLAVIKQESNFDPKALAPRGERQWFGLVEGKRLSSANGYSQALDQTWDNYRTKAGKSGADRHNFKDAVDFIGWYYNTTGEKTGLGQYDYRAHYLAYHEGATGYLQGTWKKKGWLVDAANRVASQAARYESQISGCKALKPKFLGIF